MLKELNGMDKEHEKEVLEYDVEKAKELLIAEGRDTLGLSEVIAKNIAHLHPDVWPAVRAWLNGEFIEYEFQGITYTDIMKKENGGYIGAIFSMSVLIEHPEHIENWKKCSFRRM